MAPRSQRLSGRGCLGPGSTPPRPCPGPAAAALDAHGMEGRPEPPPSCWTAPGAPQPDLRLSFAERSARTGSGKSEGAGSSRLALFPNRRVLSGQTGATRCTEPRWPCARGRSLGVLRPLPSLARWTRPSAELDSRWAGGRRRSAGRGSRLGRGSTRRLFPSLRALPDPATGDGAPSAFSRLARQPPPLGYRPGASWVARRPRKSQCRGIEGGGGRGTVLSLGQPRLEGGRFFSFQTCKMSPEPLVPRSGARQLLQPLIDASLFPFFT